jgi:endonuclease/exonuclease/phosphatase family metal-dependent hydrolase
MTGLTLLYFVKISFSLNTKTDNMKVITKILLQALLAVSCITISYADETRHPVDTIRVMSYNIHTGVGVDGVFNLERIARLITDYNIDITGLQEIDQGVERTDRVDTMKKLSELTGMYAAFGKAISFQGGEYGNGILSRYPIITEHNHPYLFEQSGEHRALLYVFVEYGHDTLFVMNTHLDHRPDDTERLKSMEEILSIASKYEDIPVFLIGDMNDTPGSRVVSKLKETFSDVWDEAGEGAGYTFHNEDLNRRIDYIFYPGTMAVNPAGVYFKPIRAYTIQTPASDHLLVVAEYEVYVDE